MPIKCIQRNKIYRFRRCCGFLCGKSLSVIYVGISDIRPFSNLIPTSNFTFISCGHIMCFECKTADLVGNKWKQYDCVICSWHMIWFYATTQFGIQKINQISLTYRTEQMLSGGHIHIQRFDRVQCVHNQYMTFAEQYDFKLQSWIALMRCSYTNISIIVKLHDSEQQDFCMYRFKCR